MRARARAAFEWLRAGQLREPRTLTRWIFLRALGVITLIAFVSLWWQLEGLIGRHGIAPAGETLEWGRQLGWFERIHRIPTLAWLGGTGGFLHVLCAAGVVAALALIANLAPRLALGVLFVSYLSLSSISDPFLNFQWDAMLVEVLFLSIFLAPGGLTPGLAADRPPAPLAVWLLGLTLFRLHFMSGVVKLTSGDSTWTDLTALRVHYQTQPLPSLVSYWMHQLPGWAHSLSAVIMFTVELVLPLLFAWRKTRIVAAAGMALLQIAILATGNYAFFNWLTLILCIVLIDDRMLRRTATAAAPRAATVTAAATARRLALATFAVVAVVVSLFEIAAAFAPRARLPGRKLVRWIAPLQLVNPYGLFRVMTTERPEIIIEGSDDGVSWKPYELPWKPGDPARAPGFVAPHQPRLDWQLWFAALAGDCRHPSAAWYGGLARALLEGRPQVLALFEHVPFGKPPRYLRAELYDYRFTNFGDDDYWRRERIGEFCPPLALENGELSLTRP